MSRTLLLLAMAGLVGCTSYAELNAPVAQSVKRPTIKRHVVKPAVVKQEAPAEQQPAADAPVTNNEEARRAWFEQEIERARYVPPPPIETPVTYQPPPQQYNDGYYVNQPVDPNCRQTAFPIHTALGATVGAIIGHQSGRDGEGAAIGAGLGLLFDLTRW